ncbi:MAG: hypothetical protein WD851_06190 [Pirellulales bacterium]
MSQQVEVILHQIEHLNEADRTLLDERLQELSERDWKQEAELARATARERAIDEQSIADAVEDLRYGPSTN